MEYDILDNGHMVGKADVRESGLYSIVKCFCKNEDKMQKIVARCGGSEVNIGTCIPVGKYMEVVAKIPKKRLQNIEGFYVKSTNQNVKWLPLKEGQPIECLHEILKGRLVRRGEQIGVELPVNQP